MSNNATMYAYSQDRTDILTILRAQCDPEYAAFQRKLCPTVAADAILGVRTPALRKLAKSLYGTAQAKAFLNALPHRYFEEDQLHAFLLGEERDFDLAMALTERFLPYVQNWATCDQLIPRSFARNPERLEGKINEWLISEHEYAVRFAIGLRMRYFLDERFHPDHLTQIAAIRREEYYIKMMVAWYFATALAKQYEVTLPYLIEHRLDPWTHHKTISKARESYRIPSAHKEDLAALRYRAT